VSDTSPWQLLAPPALLWTTVGTPRLGADGDIYYSDEDGLAESRAIFLAGNRLPERWQQHPHAVFTVGETGFGTGLNFLATWQAWRAAATPRPRLQFCSVERAPLRAADIAQALARWPELEPMTTELLAHYPPPVPGPHRLLFDEGAVCLDLFWGDAGDWLAWLRGQDGPGFDAWYLDGFAPAVNPDLWTPALFEALAAASRPHATLATFTAASAVASGLATAGFDICKVPGFGRKRHRLNGAITTAPRPPDAFTQTPWPHPATARLAGPGDRVLVLGAGLAGSSVALALARRGLKVTVLESAAIAGAASGNRQGVLYTRLSTQRSPVMDFALQSFLFAVRHYRQLMARGALHEGIDGQFCGALHLLEDDAETAALGTLLQDHPDLAQCALAAGVHAALPAALRARAAAAIHFPTAGWLSPPAVCRAQLAHPAIEVHDQLGPLALAAQGDGSWEAHWAQGSLSAPFVVLALGPHCNGVPAAAWLPLRAIRGQVTELPGCSALDQLATVLCHEGYLPPACEGHHCIGATYAVDDADPALRPQDHRRNLDALAAALPALASQLDAIDCSALAGRVSFRAATPDYLPIAGRLPDRAAFLDDYAALRANARRVIPRRGRYLPGLAVSTGHGSRGLTSTPLVAELIASELCGEPLPLTDALRRALAPGRFLIRDLARNRL